MNTNAVIDVGLGLILMYLVLSLLCTVANELISNATHMRAKTLAKGLGDIIDNPDVLKAFQNHGLISAANAASGGQPSYLPGKSVAMALLESLDPTKPVAVVADVKAAAEMLPDSNVRDVVLSAITNSNNDLVALRDSVAGWFDDSMDRVSGIYKRYAHTLSLIVGLVLAAALNADTLAVANGLWNDGTLRAQIVQLSSQTANAGAAAAAQAGQSDIARLRNLGAELRPFPIGWSTSSLGSYGPTAWTIVAKLIGVVMTGLALSLGAPFWFDLLNQFVNLRSTGTKPKRADGTAS